MKKIAIGQCRVSKGDKEEIKNSLESQKSEILTLAKKLGIKEEQIDWFIEEEARSSYQERADWAPFDNKIEEACSSPDIKYFLSYSQERFCRNAPRSKQYKLKLRKSNVEIRFVTGDVEDPDTINGFVQEEMGEMFAHMYSMKVSHDTLRGCKENASTRDPETKYTYHNGGSAPFWLMPVKVHLGDNKYGEPINKIIWNKNTTTHTGKIDGKEVTKTLWGWGQYLFLELRLRQHKSYRDIADFANEIKLPISRNADKVRPNTLSLQAKNQIIYGLVIYNKHTYANNKKKGSLKPETEWIIAENGVPALISKDQFDLLQEISNKKARKKDNTSPNSENVKLLVNIPDKFYCKSCGSKIISSGKHYVCSKYNSYGTKGCKASSFYIQSNWLDNEIEKEIKKSILDENTISMLYDNYVVKRNLTHIDINEDKDDETVKSIEKRIKELRKESNNLISAMTSGNVTGQALQVISNRYNSIQEDILEQEKLFIKYRQTPLESRLLTYEYFKELVCSGTKILAHSSIAEKRVFVEKCIEAITLDPVKREVNAKFDINPFWSSLENHKKTKKLEVSAFNTSSEMVAGAGFEPTTFGL